ncbi:hypothetical protein BDB01DRAFT_901145 [Pilobolus umbonatus]|nr:hypothetical protein BDB01DRAFT_901145 [Pilobolus umbonatus]
MLGQLYSRHSGSLMHMDSGTILQITILKISLGISAVSSARMYYFNQLTYGCLVYWLLIVEQLMAVHYAKSMKMDNRKCCFVITLCLRLPRKFAITTLIPWY